jgi:hypothetical protein
MSISRDFKGIWIPKEIWLHESISIQAKALWAEIWSLHDQEKGGCYASIDYLANFMNLKLTRIYEILKELKDHGLVEDVSFNGRQKIIKAIVPPVNYNNQNQVTGEQQSGKAECSSPEKRSARVRETGIPHIYSNKDKNKEYKYSSVTKKQTEEKTNSSNSLRSSEQRLDFYFSLESNKFEGITEKDKSDWKSAYPEIDIEREIIKAQEWLKSNPSKSKKKLWRKFITGWLSRANETMENKKAYRSNNSQPIDRRTLNKDGSPISSPVDGLF